MLTAAVEWILGQPPPSGPGRAARRRIQETVTDRPPLAAAPEAVEVLDNYVAVTGGAAAYASIESRITHASLRVGGENGIPLEVTIHQAPAGKSFTLIVSDYLGDVRIGTTGGQAWRSDLFQGTRWLGAGERASLIRRLRLDGPPSWRQGLRRADYLGLETVAHRPHHRLLLVPHAGSAEEHWYDVESGLLTRVIADTPAAMGSARARSEYSDYRWTGGVLLPYRSTSRILGVEQLLVVDRIEHNVQLDESLFRVPSELAEPVVRAAAP